MLTHEQAKILAFLRGRGTCRPLDLARKCLPGAAAEWLKHLLSELEYLGYIVIYCDPLGEPTAIQSTERGRLSVVESA